MLSRPFLSAGLHCRLPVARVCWILILLHLISESFNWVELEYSLWCSGRLLAVPFWIVERAREIAESASYQQRCEIRARRKTREDTGGEAGGKGTVLSAVTDAFEFPVAPARSLQVSAFSHSSFRSLLYSFTLQFSFSFLCSIIKLM